MKTIVEATVKGKQYRGTIVGFTASDTASFAIFVCDDNVSSMTQGEEKGR